MVGRLPSGGDWAKTNRTIDPMAIQSPPISMAANTRRCRGLAELCRCPWRSFASDARSFGGARRADCPCVCSAVSVLFHPAPGVALKPPKPDHRVAGFKLRALGLTECGAAGLPVSRFRHVFGEFAGRPDHGEIQPGG